MSQQIRVIYGSSINEVFDLEDITVNDIFNVMKEDFKELANAKYELNVAGGETIMTFKLADGGKAALA